MDKFEKILLTTFITFIIVFTFVGGLTVLGTFEERGHNIAVGKEMGCEYLGTPKYVSVAFYDCNGQVTMKRY